jgi:hypothetical protein
MSNIADYKLRAFRAIDDYNASQQFYEGHLRVLTEYGITNLNTTEPEWMRDENVYVVIAEDSSGETVGGLRVHKYIGQKSIPLIDALEELDAGIVAAFQRTLPAGTAEVCGLWNARKIFGRGISPLLCISSVVLVKQLGLNDFFCFSAPYTEKMIKTNGCIDFVEVGDKGRFLYPTEKFISSVLYNPDVNALEYADDYNKSRIIALFSNPNQTFVEESKRGDMSVLYDLKIA